jgi:hypothetical protein
MSVIPQAMKRIHVAGTALILSCVGLPSQTQVREDQTLNLENHFVAVEIDRTSGAVRLIRDKELNNTYALAGTGFEVTTATGTVRSISSCALTRAAALPGWSIRIGN